jgi:hypothetical protein
MGARVTTHYLDMPMRTAIAACMLLVLPILTAAQETNLQTTPATVQAGSSVLFYPAGASDVFSPGFDLAARGRLGGSGEHLPTLMFGFEYRQGTNADLFGTDVRLGYRGTGRYIFGMEAGVKIRHADVGFLSTQFVRPVFGVYGGLRVGQFQLGPEVSATIWDDATASAGLRVSYVIGGSNQ